MISGQKQQKSKVIANPPKAAMWRKPLACEFLFHGLAPWNRNAVPPAGKSTSRKWEAYTTLDFVATPSKFL
jgi:hypothetical protein